MAYKGFGGGRTLPDRREYFIERGDGFDDLLDRCQAADKCYKCGTRPVAVIQHQRSTKDHWIYLACPKHPKNRTYLNLDYIPLFRSWSFLQKIGRDELKQERKNNG